MRKIIWVLVLALVIATGMAGCGRSTDTSQNVSDNEVREEEQGKEDEIEAESSSNSNGINESAMETYGSLKEFSTRTLSGEIFTQDNLKDTDITMVNFWGTYCDPCIEELPEMAELNEELPENVRIISVCVDGNGNEELAKEIAADNNVKFPVLLDNDSINDVILKNVMFVPFTIFVDSKGNIVGNTVDGAPMNPKEVYREAINEALNAIGKPDLDGKQSDVTIDEVSNATDEMSYDDMFGMPENLEDYLYGYEVGSDIIDELGDTYTDLAKAFNAGEIDYYEFGDDLDTRINSKLREAGIYIPYASMSGLLNEIDGLTSEDYTFLNEKLNMVIGFEGDEGFALSEEDYINIENDLRLIFEKYDLNYDEVVSQLMGNNIQFAVYSISGDKVKYNNDLRANDFTVTETDREKHLKAIEQMREIIPASIWKQIGQIEFNSDGVEMVAAYTMPLDNDFNTEKFRLAIDIADIMDEEGNLTKEGISTVVHETGHIITLNTDQVNEVNWIGMGDESMQERFKADSYIMSFYNKFWLPTAGEFNGANNQMDMEAVEAAYMYYDEHSEDFVSDYAAQNVEEDMAESFMTFVLEDKPTGNTLADQKVLFYYDYPEFVEYRDLYRAALK